MLQLCSKNIFKAVCLALAVLAANTAFSQNPNSQPPNNIVGASTQVNYAPVADPQHIVVNGSQPLTITLTAYDANGDTLTFSLVTQPSQGTLSQFDPATGKVTYTPPSQLSGSDSFSFSVSDGIASSDPATVAITPPPDFALAAASGASTSATIAAGQTATFNLEISPANGFIGTVTLSCSGAPAHAPCTIDTPTLNVTGAAAPFTVNVATTARSSSLPPVIVRFRRRPMNFVPLSSAALGLLIALGAVAFLGRVRRWRPAALFLGMILLSSFLASCGGGANSLPPPVQTGTPAGSYTITVTGTSGGVNRNQTLTLTVQ